MARDALEVSRMNNHVLIADDEDDVLQLVSSNLKSAGFKVIEARNGADALEETRKRQPALIVLDWMLPDLSGIEVCKLLKGDKLTKAIPVLMLTAKTQEIDRIIRLEVGADDYVTKPFSPRELVLRVQSLLKRAGSWTQKPAPKAAQGGERDSGVVKLGPIVLDADRCEVRVQGRPLDFSRTEFKLLSVLAKNPGRVHTRDELLSQVWGYESDTETRTVDMHVLRVREKLGSSAECLETVRGFGYRMIIPAHR